MQSLYALGQGGSENVSAEEKKMLAGIDRIYDLFLAQLQLLLAIRDFAARRIENRRQKHLATEQERNPNTKFIENQVLEMIAENPDFVDYANKGISLWKDHGEYVENLWKEIEGSEYYRQYMDNPDRSLGEDKTLVVSVFKHVIAPSDALMDFYEDCQMTWTADYQVANSMVLKMLDDIKNGVKLPSLYKDEEDRIFAIDLFEKTAANASRYRELIQAKTQNWDSERIAQIDFILMEMALAEFTEFSSIPTKVTMNEYIEIAKDYSTGKSNVFINGILDKLLGELSEKGMIKKSGRGLM